MLPMSLSLNSARMRTTPRSAILTIVVPPLTEPLADAITVPSDTVLSMIVAFRRRLDRRVLERLLGEIEVGAVRDHDVGLRGLVAHRDLLELLRRDDARLEHFLIALLVALGDRQLRLGGVERRLGLVVSVLHVARVDLDDQVARIEARACFDGHLGDDARRLRFDFDDGDRLDHAIRLRVDDDVATRNVGGLHGRRLGLARAGCGGKQHQRRAEGSSHVSVSPEIGQG